MRRLLFIVVLLFMCCSDPVEPGAHIGGKAYYSMPVMDENADTIDFNIMDKENIEVQLYSGQAISDQTMTNNNGDFAFHDVDPGTYSLIAFRIFNDMKSDTVRYDNIVIEGEDDAYYAETIHVLTRGSISSSNFHSVALYPNPSSSMFTIRFSVSSAESVSIKVRDSENQVIRYLIQGQDMAAGDHYVVWDLKDSDNIVVPQGYYTIIFEVDGVDSYYYLVQVN